VYQLVPVGRGERIRDRALLVEENRRLMRTLREVQREIKTVFEPVASPQYWAYLLASGSSNPSLTPRDRGLPWSQHFKDYQADVPTTAPPPAAAPPPPPKLLEPPLKLHFQKKRQETHRYIGEIWLRGEVFRLLRDRRNLKGSCGSCRWREVCGGCRGKALAYSGDLLAEDPTCFVREDYPSSL